MHETYYLKIFPEKLQISLEMNLIQTLGQQVKANEY